MSSERVRTDSQETGFKETAHVFGEQRDVSLGCGKASSGRVSQGQACEDASDAEGGVSYILGHNLIKERKPTLAATLSFVTSPEEQEWGVQGCMGWDMCVGGVEGVILLLWISGQDFQGFDTPQPRLAPPDPTYWLPGPTYSYDIAVFLKKPKFQHSHYQCIINVS